MTEDTRQTIIGTAGHIDHGKTALVRALTGVDLDTLPDEKRRGITIELGFAFMDVDGRPSGIVFIDVPGHERLVKTMVAGASNIDAVMLVIAADEGVSAQTIEHFDIIRLLEIKEGIIVITKSDLVDEHQLQTVKDDIRRFVAESFLENAPILPVSAVTGTGIDDLKARLLELAARPRTRPDSGTFRMPIDRVFALKGFGAVIAGTILSGRVSVGDKIEILPEGLTARVRGLQIHGASVESSGIGNRTAINLQDVKKEQLRRGQCAAAPGTLTPTIRIDGRLNMLKNASESLKTGTRVRFHTGTDEVIGRVALLESQLLQPGETGTAQFVLESATTAVRGDRFIVRTFSSMRTIGGGTILDAHALRHKRGDWQGVSALSSLDTDTARAVEQAYVKAGFVPLTPAEVANVIGESEEQVMNAVLGLVADSRLVEVQPGGQYIHADALSGLEERLLSMIQDYYEQAHFRVTMPAADLQSRFLRLAGRHVYDTLLRDLSERGVVEVRENRVGMVGHQAEYKPGEREAYDRIETAYHDAWYTPPSEEEVLSSVRVSPRLFSDLIAGLLDQGVLVRLDKKVLYHRDALEAARTMLVEHLLRHGQLTPADVRDLLHVSRKYAIPLLEYLDLIGVTKREGDYRVLKQPSAGSH